MSDTIGQSDLKSEIARKETELLGLRRDLERANYEAGGAVLDIPMDKNDAKAACIQDYLQALLLAIVTEQDGFSSKRPFGNSGWIYDMHLALVYSGAVNGVVSEYDDIRELGEYDEVAAQNMLFAAIRAM